MRKVLPRLYNHPKDYVILPPAICGMRSAHESVNFFVVVVSAVDQIERRQAIRRTWGRDLKLRGNNSLVFLLGKAENTEQQRRVFEESGEHFDIVQGEMWEGYRNLTVKSVQALHLATTHCRQASFLLKTDDDTFVNCCQLLKTAAELRKDAITARSMPTIPPSATRPSSGEQTRVASRWGVLLFYRAETQYVLILPLRPSAWFQCRLKIVASATLLTLLAYFFLRLVAPVISAIFAETPLRWFHDPNIAKQSIPTERLHNKPHRYLINPQGICPIGQPIDYLFMVYSAPEYVEARSVIRRTWASDAKRYSGNKVLFLFGKPSNDRLQSVLEFESQQYGDIVQESFMDTYRNLTLKTVMMLRWASQNCPQARFVVKIDDDCFPNLANFYRAMHGQAEDTIYGELRHRDRPYREIGHKWYLSPEEFPRDVFPDYITGGMYVVGGRVVNLLYRATGQVPFFRVEDIYLTGMCAERAGITRVNLEGTYNLKLSTLCEYKKAIYGHHVTPVEMNEVWHAMKRLEYKCRRLLFSVHLCYCRPVDTSAGLVIETPVF
ncbi:hypothetical protein HPB51_006231 [Rhipicephalus microplus]|uniref:Hexosyltransferase n=1 Tax=Rhipicephalus microplus TaxID=6941 RepID=A0A9J6DLU8_RHIMP|nr:hypothetical protein HPB51_006231 [Rhipicephalus microplus]